MNDFTKWLDEDHKRRHNWFLFLLEIVEPEITDEQKMKDYNNGLTDKQLGELWGLTRSGASRWRESKGLDSNVLDRAEERIKDIKEGLDVWQLAEKWKISERGVKQFIEKYGEGN